MRRDFDILVINPGSTSTKVAVYTNSRQLFAESRSHSADELRSFRHVNEQLPLRRECVKAALEAHGYDPARLSAIAARGGRLRPVASGTYLVNQRMMDDARNGFQGEHASNLACLIAQELAGPLGIPCYVVDPVSVDELDAVARFGGIAEIQRTSLSHALNMKAVARKAAAELGKTYAEARLIVAHLGGGGSVSAHLGGRMVDLFNSDKEGPFVAERAGGLPTLELVELCFSGRFTREEILRKLVGGGGLASHLGTKDLREVERRIAAGDGQAAMVFAALCYQVAKAISALGATLEGRIDAVVLTGGMVASGRLVEEVSRRVAFLAPVLVYPGEFELEALALGVLRVLTGEEVPKVYE